MQRALAARQATPTEREREFVIDNLLFRIPLINPCRERERDFFIDNLLVRIHLIIEMILVDWPCAMGV